MITKSDSRDKKSEPLPAKEGTRDRATAVGFAAFFFGMLVSLTMREQRSMLLSVAAVCLSIAAPLALSSAGIAGVQLSNKAYTEKSHSYQGKMFIASGLIGFLGIAIVLYEYHWFVSLSFAVASVIVYMIAHEACTDLEQSQKENKT